MEALYLTGAKVKTRGGNQGYRDRTSDKKLFKAYSTTA